jgi:hypothetical protein
MHLKLSNLIEDINIILKKHSINEQINYSSIITTENIVYDSLVPSAKKLSKLIIDSIWPSINNQIVYHYTNKSVVESIINNQTFRLYCISKRFHENEILTFCQNHSLTGYLHNNEYKKLMSNTFYSSFTDTNLDIDEEKYFWNNFTLNNEGVRLKLKITATSPDFRKIKYEEAQGKAIPILNDLVTVIRKKYNREFILAGISRLCSFYLPSKWKVENETRILFRVWENNKGLIKNDNLNDYIEIPLEVENGIGFKLEIIEIQTDEDLNIEKDNYTIISRNT